jgi:regulator of replication initiation timing
MKCDNSIAILIGMTVAITSSAYPQVPRPETLRPKIDPSGAIQNRRMVQKIDVLCRDLETGNGQRIHNDEVTQAVFEEVSQLAKQVQRQQRQLTELKQINQSTRQINDSLSATNKILQMEVLKLLAIDEREEKPTKALWEARPSYSAVPVASYYSRTLSIVQPELSPPEYTGLGASVGTGALHINTTRVAGYPQYGNVLLDYLATPNIPANQEDIGFASWATGQSVSTGGAVFAGWFGANSPGIFESPATGATIGLEINSGNRNHDFGLQSDVGGTAYTVGLQLAPDVVPTTDTLQYDVSITAANPAVITLAHHGFTAGLPVTIGIDGSFGGFGVKGGAIYYVLPQGLTANTFEFSTSIGGSPVSTAGRYSGKPYIIPSFPGSFGLVIGASIHNHKWWTGTLTRYDTIMPGGYTHVDYGASFAGVNGSVPLAWTLLGGHFVNGLDLTSASFTGSGITFDNTTVGASGINFNSNTQKATAATAGSYSSPGGFAGYVKVSMSGKIIKIPYFNN